MSVDDTFRAALLAHAPLAALVGQRIARNAVPQGSPPPVIAFATAHNPQFGLDGAVNVDQVSFTVECWAANASQATAVGDAVTEAVETFDGAQPIVCATVVARTSVYDGELGLDGEILTIEWFQQ